MIWDLKQQARIAKRNQWLHDHDVQLLRLAKRVAATKNYVDEDIRKQALALVNSYRRALRRKLGGRP